MIEKVRDLLVEANVREVPIIALLAQRTHDKVTAFGTRLHGDRVVVHCEHSVEEDDDADDGRRQQPARVEPEPGEVDGDLLTKVLSDVVERLIFVPFAPRGPITTENLPNVQLARRNAFARMLERAL